jgi:hypothetical protein
MRTHKLGIGPRHYFTDAEVEAVRKSANRRGITVQNGITFSLLRERYRRPVYHMAGKGWFYYPASPLLPKSEVAVGQNGFTKAAKNNSPADLTSV